MDQKSASLDGPESCSADATYNCASKVATLRSQMQHKCVEMSLHITTGLAAGVFALMFTALSTAADISTLKTPAKVCLVIVIDLYTVLQLLILGNYLFHTFLGTINWLVPHAFSKRYGKAIDERVLKDFDERVLQKLETPPTLSRKTDCGVSQLLPAFDHLLLCVLRGRGVPLYALAFPAYLLLAWLVLRDRSQPFSLRAFHIGPLSYQDREAC